MLSGGQRYLFLEALQQLEMQWSQLPLSLICFGPAQMINIPVACHHFGRGWYLEQCWDSSRNLGSESSAMDIVEPKLTEFSRKICALLPFLHQRTSFPSPGLWLNPWIWGNRWKENVFSAWGELDKHRSSRKHQRSFFKSLRFARRLLLTNLSNT